MKPSTTRIEPVAKAAAVVLALSVLAYLVIIAQERSNPSAGEGVQQPSVQQAPAAAAKPVADYFLSSSKSALPVPLSGSAPDARKKVGPFLSSSKKLNIAPLPASRKAGDKKVD